MTASLQGEAPLAVVGKTMNDVTLTRPETPGDENLLSEDAAENTLDIAPPFPWPRVTTVSGFYYYAGFPFKAAPFPAPRVPKPIPIDLPPPLPVPTPRPPLVPAAGSISVDAGEAGAEAANDLLLTRAELRLDVDGASPRMVASGLLLRGAQRRVHWVANLKKKPSTPLVLVWVGTIWYVDGDAGLLPSRQVEISVNTLAAPANRTAKVVFTGASPTYTINYAFKSHYFHDVEFEFDSEQGARTILEINTGDHPDRPPAMPTGKLTIDEAFKRAGVNVRRSAGVSTISSDGPDANATWSDAEMHDAMQVYWSRFSASAQWAMWVLFARRHDMGTGLGGIMFDSIGAQHRQGTALFTDSFISQAPAGDPQPDAWVRRMIYWTAVHEMGHGFNLAHAWQKHLGKSWIPMTSDKESRSFMNYPFNVAGGVPAFFSSFQYTFAADELLFLRHAPERFVEMGAAAWFDNHGFQNATLDPTDAFKLEVTVNRAQNIYAFLEPIVIDVHIRNVSDGAKLLPSDILKESDHLTVIIKKDGQAAREWRPYARYCHRGEAKVLMPGDALSESMFVSAGLDGWNLAEPGLYTVQLMIEVDGYDVLSTPTRIRILPPASRDEEFLAQDVLTDDAGRVMAFDGSVVLESGVNAWGEVAERMPDSPAAVHAKVCLAMPYRRAFRTLAVDGPGLARALDGRTTKGVFHTRRPSKERVDEAVEAMSRAHAGATLGSIDLAYYENELVSSTEDEAAPSSAHDAMTAVIQKAARRVKKPA